MTDVVIGIATAIGVKVVKKLFDYVSSKVNGQISLKENISFLRETLPVVKHLMLNAQAVIVHGEISSESGVLSNSKVFVKGLKQFIYDGEDILDEFDMDSEGKETIAKKIEGLYKELHALKEKNLFLQVLNDILLTFPEAEVGSSGSPRFRNTSLDMIDRADFHMVGRDQEKSLVEEYLLGNSKSKPSVVLLTGMAGIGKTTLARDIFKDSQICKHFALRKWVTVEDRNLDPKKVLNQLIGGATCADTLDSKKFLLVVDGVWDAKDLKDRWNELWLPLSRDRQGSRVMVTTRQKNVISKMEALQVNVKRLGLLSDKACLEIFKFFAFPPPPPPPPSFCMEKAETIVRDQVKGLPLAARVIGSSLKGKEREDWEAAAARVRVKESDINSSILRSYLNLSMELKQCFTSCCFFPKGTELSKTELVQLWMAHSFVKDSNSPTMVATGEKYFDDLVDASLIQKESAAQEGARYTMHDLIHEFALEILGDEFSSGGEGSDYPQTSRHLVIFENNQKLPTNLSRVRSLSINIDGRSIEKLKELTHVRFLHISGAMFSESLSSSLSGMNALQTLILELTNAPSRRWDFFGGKSKPLPSSLKHLQIHKLNFLQPSSQQRPKTDYLLKALQKQLPSSLEHLEINSCDDFRALPDQFPSSLERLIIASCNKLQTLPPIESLRFLKYLVLRSCRDLGKLQGKFPSSLKHLEIWKWSKLENLPEELPSSLEQLKIGYCEHLQALPEGLPYSLRILVIYCCNKLQGLPNSLPPYLEYVEIDSCDNLGGTFPEEIPSSMQYLGVHCCPKLQISEDKFPSTLKVCIDNVPTEESSIQISRDICIE